MEKMQETRVQFLGPEDPLEKGMATYSSIVAWRIPWTEEPAKRVAKSWTQLSTHSKRERESVSRFSCV